MAELIGQDLTEKLTAQRNIGLLSVLVATLLLFVIAIPIISSRLDSLWFSEFTFHVDVRDPACVPSGLCFRLLAHSFERTTTGRRIPLRIEGVRNIYELAEARDKGALKAIVVGGKQPTIELDYKGYVNTDETAQQIPAALQFDEQPTGQIRLAFEYRGQLSDYRVLSVSSNDIGWLASILPLARDQNQMRGVVGLIILVIAGMTSFLEARAARRWVFGHACFAAAMAFRWAAITAAGNIASPMLCVTTILAILLPWLAIARRQWWPIRETHTLIGRRLTATAAELVPRLWRGGWRNERFSAVELGLLVVSLGLFAYTLWSGSSFRWSIFEERDFLEARQLLSSWTLPIYGPELLAGGHTIGGTLYLMLAAVVALWNDPGALLLFNRLLFLGMPLVLWWGMRGWVGPAGALFAVFALVAAERMVALSYWPIHPNFSLFFAFFYACAVLRGAVGRSRSWLIFSGLLLGILTQLHFSYFLLFLCHVLLVAFANGQDRRTKSIAIAAVFIPLLPFLVVDAMHGFPNILQIVQQPRAHPVYVPAKPFGNAFLLPLIFSWPREIPGLLSNALSTFTVLLIGLGAAIGIGAAAGSTKSNRLTPALVVAILFSVPAFGLTILGMGYNSRHTLATVPAQFMLAGIGFAGMVNMVWPARQGLGMLLIVPLVVVLGWRAGNSAMIERISRTEGEWAVDYRSREAIAKDLAARLRMSPDTYAARTFWWWMGWSIDPTIYADIYRRVVPSSEAEKPVLTSDQYVLVTGQAELPPFLKNVFDDNESRPVGGMYVHVATTKKNLAMPSANTDTGVRLHPFLEQVDQLPGQPPGFAHIAQEQFGTARRDLFLGTIAEGRIKLLISTEQDESQGRGRLRWCVDSPTLNGHYWEMKTIWRPRLLLVPEFGTAVDASLASDVLGSLPYKTPRCGEAWSDRMGSWKVTFAFDGEFDQSFMRRPELSQQRWPLDFGAPIRNTSLSHRAIVEWISAPFGR